MSTTAQPVTRVRSRSAGPRSRASVARWFTGGLLIAAGLLAVLAEHAIRVLETHSATALARATFATDTMFAWSGDVPVLGFTTGHGWFAAQATSFSGSAIFAGAVALAGGALILTGQLSWARAMSVTGISVIALLILGQLRLLLMAYTMVVFAQPGAHALDNPIGVVLMIVATAGVFTYFFFAVRSARRARSA